MTDIGAQLRAAREARGLTLQDIEQATRIRVKYLRALEEGNFEVLPETVYVRGFLKAYAREVGLDPDPLLAQIGPPPESVPEPSTAGQLLAEPLQPTPLPIGSIVSILVALLLIGALSFAVWWVYPRRADFMGFLAFVPTPPDSALTPEETAIGIVPLATATIEFIFEPTISPDATATVTPVPTATTPPRPTSTPTAGGPTATPEPSPTVEGVRLQVEIVDRSWIWVRVDGAEAFMGTLEAGEEREWQGNETIFLRTGNAAGVQVTLNGEPLGVLGRQGEVVNRTWERNPEGGLPIEVEATQQPAATATGD